MKIALLALAALPLAYTLQDEGERPEPQHHEESPLQERMHEIEEHLGLLRRTLRDEGATATSLEHLVAIQKATFAARFEVPSLAATLPDEERPAFVREYRKTLIEMLRTELDLETALLDEDYEAAKTAFQSLRALEDSGHERFTDDL